MQIAFGNAIGLTNANLKNYVNSLKPKAWFKSTDMSAQGYSLDFDGTDDYVEADNEITAYPFTLECWVRLDVTNASQSLVLLSKTSDSIVYFGLRYVSSTGEFAIFSRNTTEFITRGTTIPAANTWYHVAAVFTSATSRTLYVNGIAEATGTDSSNYSNVDIKVLLGLFRTTNPAGYLNGQLSDVRIWNTARTAQQIADNYNKRLIGNESGLVGYWKLDEGNATTAKDYTSNANDGTISGAIWDNDEPFTENISDFTGVRVWKDISGNGYDATQTTSANRPTYRTNQINGKPALVFDGVNDNLSIPSSNINFKFMHSTDSTVFMVCQAGTVINPGVNYGLLHTATGTSNVGFYFRYADQVVNDRIAHNIYFGTSNQLVSNQQTLDNSFPANQFNYFNIVSKPTDATASERSAIQINNGTVIKNNTSTNTASTSNSSIDLQIGGSSSNTVPYLNGLIAEIIIYDRALTLGEIQLVHQYIKQEYDL